VIGESNSHRYIVKSLVHASQVLAAFQREGEVLRLRDVVARTGITRGTCFRILYTLHSCGLLEKIGENQYRAIGNRQPHRRFRIGYAAHGQEAAFPREVNASLVRAAQAADVELVVLDNRYDAKVALRNADRLVREEVDLAIEFQADDAAAPAVASKILEAGIPLIAIDIPHPGATYFGANNYSAGLMAGRHLGRWIMHHWRGEADEVVMMELTRSGSLPQARIRGMLAGLSEVVRHAGQWKTTHLDGDGQFRTSLEALRRHLRGTRTRRMLVGAATDPSALGALRAIEEAGRAEQSAVVGQNADAEGRAEMRAPRTRLIGSVAYFPEEYGTGVIQLALEILAHKTTPPAVFTKHQLVTPENVDHLYPNDTLLGIGQIAQA